MNKTLKNILCYVLALSIVFALAAIASKHMTDKHMQNLQESLDEADRDIAINRLYQLRGRISEINLLSCYLEMPKEVLLERLDNIVTDQNFHVSVVKNKYLADFTFVTPDSSSVGELCDILISQIDNYIYTIKYVEKDALASFFIL